MDMEKSTPHKQCNPHSNETSRTPNHPPAYQYISTLEERGESSMNALLGSMFPTSSGSTLFHPQPVSTLNFQHALDTQNLQDHLHHQSQLDFSIPTVNQPISQPPYASSHPDQHDRLSMAPPLSDPHQMPFTYDDTIQYHPTQPHPSPSTFTHPHDTTSINENIYPAPYYWNTLPTPYARHHASRMPIRINPLESPSPHHSFIPSISSSFDQPESHSISYPDPYHESDPTNRAMKRMKPRCSQESQACTSAEMSFASSTDDNSSHELHLLESSISSSGMMEGPTGNETSPNDGQKSMVITSGSLATTTTAYAPPTHEHPISPTELDSHHRKRDRLETSETHVGMDPEPFNFFQQPLSSRYPRVPASQARLDSTSHQAPSQDLERVPAPEPKVACHPSLSDSSASTRMKSSSGVGLETASDQGPDLHGLRPKITSPSCHPIGLEPAIIERAGQEFVSPTKPKPKARPKRKKKGVMVIPSELITRPDPYTQEMMRSQMASPVIQAGQSTLPHSAGSHPLDMITPSRPERNRRTEDPRFLKRGSSAIPHYLPPTPESLERPAGAKTMVETEDLQADRADRVEGLEKALEALDTLTDYLSREVEKRSEAQFLIRSSDPVLSHHASSSASGFVTPQHFFVLGELGGRLRRRLDVERA